MLILIIAVDNQFQWTIFCRNYRVLFWHTGKHLDFHCFPPIMDYVIGWSIFNYNIGFSLLSNLSFLLCSMNDSSWKDLVMHRPFHRTTNTICYSFSMCGSKKVSLFYTRISSPKVQSSGKDTFARIGMMDYQTKKTNFPYSVIIFQNKLQDGVDILMYCHLVMI